jgi:uncharacterized protein DUF4389
MAAMAMDSQSGYPVRLDIPYPESLSRWLIFVKWLLVIPHLIILTALGIALWVTTIIAFFSILITTKYPEGLFKFAVGVTRWSENATAYMFLLRDEYPPFSMDAGQYSVVFEADYPTDLNRWLPLIKWLLVLPVAIVGLVVLYVAYLTTLISWFAILFTGKYPRGLFDFAVGALRWNIRANAYSSLWTDRYPPFSLK